MKLAKVILYPIAGIAQLWLCPSRIMGIVLAVALIGLALLNLKKLIDAPKSGLNVLTAAQHSLAETSGDEDMSWVELSENTWRHP